MGKVVNVIDLGDGNYEVVSTKNTIAYKIGKVINEGDIAHLLASNYDVNVKAKKENKE